MKSSVFCRQQPRQRSILPAGGSTYARPPVDDDRHDRRLAAPNAPEHSFARRGGDRRGFRCAANDVFFIKSVSISAQSKVSRFPFRDREPLPCFPRCHPSLSAPCLPVSRLPISVCVREACACGELAFVRVTSLSFLCVYMLSVYREYIAVSTLVIVSI